MMKPLPRSLQQAIAKKYADKVDEGWSEDDGFNENGGWAHWVYLKPGWCNYLGDPWGGLHTIHECTVKDVLAYLKEVRPCDCGQCKKAIHQAKILGKTINSL